jgi:eukaryotic-like serine/threonine-protein kinase
MTVAPQTSWPPTVGRYLLYGEIASGGMATVHFGRLQGAAGFARSVAIKRLHPQYARDPDFVEMFLDEARLAARIAHPNVVPTLDIVAQGDELLLVMEYVRGSALSRLLRTLTQKSERMPPRIAAAIAAGMLRGLHAAHEAKSEIGDPLEIVHRDVSPQNVLVGTDGIPKVLDFGVAKAAGRVQTTREGQLKGKLAYMAPEQITTGSVTRKTDIYASAVVLWEMLTGRRLFRAENEAKLLSLVLDGDVQPPSVLVEGLPDGFDQVVLRGIDRDPAKRYSTAREMAIDVEAVLGVAQPAEVGEWVELTAAEELRERTNRIEEIERSIRGVPRGAPSGGWPTALTQSGLARRGDSSPTLQQGRGVQRLLPPPPPPSSHTPAPPLPSQRVVSQVSQVSHLSVSHTDPPRRAARRPTGMVVAIAVALSALGGTVLALRPSHSSAAGPVAAPPPPPPATALAGPTPKPTQSPPPGAQPASSAQEAAPQPPPPKASVYSLEDLPTPAKMRFGKPLPVLPNPPPQAAPQPPPPPPPKRQPTECNPPYTTDDKGHIHFKPACLN